MLAKLLKQQGCFTKLHTSKDAAAKTSFVISHKIAKNRKPFSDRKFIKECLWTVLHYYAQRKRTHMQNGRFLGALSRGGSKKSREMLSLSCKKKTDNFEFFSMAMDASCNVRDSPVTHLYTRDNEIPRDYSGAGINAVNERDNNREGFVHRGKCMLTCRQFVALQEEHETEHIDIGYHTTVRWLSLGNNLSFLASAPLRKSP